MEAVEFLKLRRRFCGAHDCGSCMFDGCVPDANDASIEQYATAVIKWGEEHPVKTRKTEFLKMFPHSQEDPKTWLCVAYFDTTKACKASNPSDEMCEACREKFWDEELRE